MADLSPSSEQYLPHNIECEAALIGSVLMHNTILHDLPVDLTEQHFYVPLHGRMWARINQLIDDGAKEVTPITLKPYFENDPDIIEAGGVGYLAKLTADSAGILGAYDFANQLNDLFALRNLIEAATETISRASDTSETIDPLAVVREHESAIYDIASQSERKPALNMAESFENTIEQMRLANEDQGNVYLNLDGSKALQDAIGNPTLGSVTVIGGRPGMGKTELARTMTRIAGENGQGSIFFSQEMPHDDLMRRYIADICAENPEGPDLAAITSGKFTELERAIVMQAGETLSSLPIYIDTQSSLNMGDIRRKTASLKRRADRDGYTVKLIVVDYLTLMEGDNSRQDRLGQLSKITRDMKTLAKDENVHVVLVSQLSRAVEQREDKRPMLADLRDSGSIEQDADNVIFPFREQYYLEQSEPKSKGHDDREWADWQAKMTAARNKLDLIVAKRRQGRKTTTRCQIFLKHMAIRDMGWQRPTGDGERFV